MLECHARCVGLASSHQLLVFLPKCTCDFVWCLCWGRGMLLCPVLERGKGRGAGGAARFWRGLWGNWRRASLLGLENRGPQVLARPEEEGSCLPLPGQTAAEAGQGVCSSPSIWHQAS